MRKIVIPSWEDACRSANQEQEKKINIWLMVSVLVVASFNLGSGLLQSKSNKAQQSATYDQQGR